MALTLSFITAVEVGIFYIEMVPALFVACFFILSATKFVMVALFYMHLRYDARLFSTLFFGGVVLAMVVVVAVLAIFGTLLVNPTRESQEAIKAGTEHAGTVIEQPVPMTSMIGGSIDGASLELPTSSPLNALGIHEHADLGLPPVVA